MSQGVKWNKTGDNQWTTREDHAGCSGVIDFTPPGSYVLAITGDGQDAALNFARDHSTFDTAREAFHDFLLARHHDKSEMTKIVCIGDDSAPQIFEATCPAGTDIGHNDGLWIWVDAPGYGVIVNLDGAGLPGFVDNASSFGADIGSTMTATQVRDAILAVFQAKLDDQTISGFSVQASGIDKIRFTLDIARYFINKANWFLGPDNYLLVKQPDQHVDATQFATYKASWGETVKFYAKCPSGAQITHNDGLWISLQADYYSGAVRYGFIVGVDGAEITLFGAGSFAVEVLSADTAEQVRDKIYAVMRDKLDQEVAQNTGDAAYFDVLKRGTDELELSLFPSVTSPEGCDWYTDPENSTIVDETYETVVDVAVSTLRSKYLALHANAQARASAEFVSSGQVEVEQVQTSFRLAFNGQPADGDTFQLYGKTVSFQVLSLVFVAGASDINSSPVKVEIGATIPDTIQNFIDVLQAVGSNIFNLNQYERPAAADGNSIVFVAGSALPGAAGNFVYADPPHGVHASFNRFTHAWTGGSTTAPFVNSHANTSLVGAGSGNLELQGMSYFPGGGGNYIGPSNGVDAVTPSMFRFADALTGEIVNLTCGEDWEPQATPAETATVIKGLIEADMLAAGWTVSFFDPYDYILKFTYGEYVANLPSVTDPNSTNYFYGDTTDEGGETVYYPVFSVAGVYDDPNGDTHLGNYAHAVQCELAGGESAAEVAQAMVNGLTTYASTKFTAFHEGGVVYVQNLQTGPVTDPADGDTGMTVTVDYYGHDAV